jgi:DNA-binding phage protein
MALSCRARPSGAIKGRRRVSWRGQYDGTVSGDGDGVLEMGGPAAVGGGDAPSVGQRAVTVVAALTEHRLDRDRGRALGQVLRAARGPRSAAEVAHRAGISLDTLRKIERGAISSPAFFTVAALAGVLDLDLSVLARDLMPAETPERRAAS